MYIIKLYWLGIDQRIRILLDGFRGNAKTIYLERCVDYKAESGVHWNCWCLCVVKHYDLFISMCVLMVGIVKGTNARENIITIIWKGFWGFCFFGFQVFIYAVTFSLQFQCLWFLTLLYHLNFIFPYQLFQFWIIYRCIISK